MKSSGLPSHLLRRPLTLSAFIREEEAGEERTVALTLGHVESMVAFWAVGMAVSLAAFVVEIAMF